MKYAILDANNSVREVREDYGTLPQNAVLLSDAQYNEITSSADGIWKFAGGEFEKTPAPVSGPVVPTSISMAQACLALYQSGLLDAVEALISDQGRAAQIEWQRRQTVERSHPLVQFVKTELPLTEQQLDDLFTLGATL